MLEASPRGRTVWGDCNECNGSKGCPRRRTCDSDREGKEVAGMRGSIKPLRSPHLVVWPLRGRRPVRDRPMRIGLFAAVLLTSLAGCEGLLKRRACQDSCVRESCPEEVVVRAPCQKIVVEMPAPCALAAGTATSAAASPATGAAAGIPAAGADGRSGADARHGAHDGRQLPPGYAAPMGQVTGQARPAYAPGVCLLHVRDPLPHSAADCRATTGVRHLPDAGQSTAADEHHGVCRSHGDAHADADGSPCADADANGMPMQMPMACPCKCPRPRWQWCPRPRSTMGK